LGAGAVGESLGMTGSEVTDMSAGHGIHNPHDLQQLEDMRRNAEQKSYLEQSCELIQQETGLQLECIGRSEIGQDWVDVARPEMSINAFRLDPDDLSDLLHVAADLCKDKRVEDAVNDRVHHYTWSRDALTNSQVGSESEFESVSQYVSEELAAKDAKIERLEKENRALRDPVRREHMPHVDPQIDCQAFMPHCFLYAGRDAPSSGAADAASRANGRPAVARVQALARGRLVRRGFYDLPRQGFHGLQAWASARVAVVRIEPSIGPDGAARANVTIGVVHPDNRRRAAEARRKKHAREKQIIVAAAIVVGVLAMIIRVNPVAARTAAVGAASTLVALLNRPRAAA